MFATDTSRAPASEDLSSVGASMRGMLDHVVARLPMLAVGLTVFVLSIAVAHFARWGIKRATRNSRRANVGIVLGRLGFFGIILLGALVAVTIVAPSMTPARLVSVLGLGGVAIGFAFKDIFQNMLAGVLLLWREPFRVGDEITADSFTGTVESIETRATLVKTYDGKRIIIPNAQIYTEPVAVISAYDMLRSEYDVGIGYGDDVASAKEILLDIVTSTEGILQKPEPDLIVWELADSTVNIRVRWWTKPDRGSVVRLRGRVLEQICERFPAAGIDLPYPTQVMLFHDQTEETDGDRSRQREGRPAVISEPTRASTRRELVPLRSARRRERLARDDAWRGGASYPAPARSALLRGRGRSRS